MSKFSKVIWLACLLSVVIACGRSSTRQTSVQASSWYDSEAKGSKSSFPPDPAIARFSVPPEIALVNANIRSTSTSFDQAVELLDSGSKKLLTSVAGVDGCSAKIVDYQHPVTSNYSRKTVRAEDRKYTTNQEVEILISFAKSKNISDRIQQLNTCLKAIPSLKIEPTSEDKGSKTLLSLSPVLFSINDAGKYRQKLLEFKFKPLKEVASLSNPATQFKSTDTKCTSEGVVRVIKRNINGIELDVDLDCRRFVDGKLIVESK